METNIQPTEIKLKNVTTILDSISTATPPPSTEDVETVGFNNIKQFVNENDHLQYKKTTQKNEIETTNGDSDGEPIVFSSADDVDESKMIRKEKQVDVHVKPQLQPQNVEDKEHNDVTDDDNDDGDETISNGGKQYKYEDFKENQEDDLLTSDNEDADNIEAHKENVATDVDGISLEQEEELLKSEDEDDISAEKECQRTNLKTTSKEITNQHIIIDENQTDDNSKINTLDLEKVIKRNQSNPCFYNYNELKTENSYSESHALKQCNDVKNKSFHENDGYQHKSENAINEHCTDDNQILERKIKSISQPRVRQNTTNHRILYQFDLDDESSSQDSFQYKISPPIHSSEDKKENVLDNSSVIQPQFYGSAMRDCFSETTDIEDVKNKDYDNRNEENSENKAENDSEVAYSPSDKLTASHSDGAVSDNETDTPYLSPRLTSVKNEESNSDNEIRKETCIPALQTPHETSPKSEELSFDEDNRLDQDVDDVNESRKNSTELLDSWKSTTEKLCISNKSRTDNEKCQNKTTLIDNNLLITNEIHLNDTNANDRNEKENKLQSLKLNGDHDAESENDSSYSKKNEESQISILRRTSFDSKVMNSTPENEKIQTIERKTNKVNSFGQQEPIANISNDNKMEIESLSKSLSKVNKNTQKCFNDDCSDNEVASKPNFSLSLPFAILSEEQEASRSSLASSDSYSTTTSSSQHLVIDHPMEDIKDVKVKPLKITLKRKLSDVNDDCEVMGPQHKRVYMYEENQEELNTKSFFCNKVNEHMDMTENVQEHLIHKVDKLARSRGISDLEQNEEKIQYLLNETDLAEPLSSKSLLLQQLEKPLATPHSDVLPPLTFAPTQLTTPPFSTTPVVSTQTVPIPLVAPLDTGVTKYLCFKCKIGTFDTFAALIEHQAICLVSHSLLPFNQTTIQTSPLQPTSPPPLSSLENLKISLGNNSASPIQPAFPSTKQRYYKCSTCKTFHENWNLFLHIREQHDRHVCLYCVRFFPTAEKLALHLEIKHDLEQNHFNTEDAIRNSIPVMEGYALESRFLMCCTCQHIFMENEEFSQHDCNDFMKPCSLCGQKGRHTSQCKAHPDSKRFSKLKKKKEKLIHHSEALRPLPSTIERSQKGFTDTPITISNHHSNPTIISDSNLNCDSGPAEKHQQPQTFNSMNSEDSNSSNNMVIDESCNVSHMPPARTEPHDNSNDNASLTIQMQLEPRLSPDRQLVENDLASVQPLKLVVPKFKLRVPKEFQKSVDDELSTSDSEEEIEDQEEEEQRDDKKDNIETEKYYAATTNAVAKETSSGVFQNLFFAESTPANSQDMEIERNLATEPEREVSNSQDESACQSGGTNSKSQNPALSLDDDDSLDEPNSNLVRIMQEIERTKLDIQRTKKTSIRHNKPFALPRQPNASQSSNRTADHNWSPTPPASPNSRWFTPRRSTTSQSCEEHLQKTPQQQQHLLPPPSPVKKLSATQERRDTIGSDMMDIDETITSQPTQTIYCSKLRLLDNGNFNNSSESYNEKSFNESMETSQITDNETSMSVLESEKCNKLSSMFLPDQRQNYVEKESKLEIDLQQVLPPEISENIDLSLQESTEHENNKHTSMRQHQENEAEDDTEINVCDNEELEEHAQKSSNEKPVEVEKLPPADGIEVANDDTVVVDMKLDRPLDKYEVIDFLRICLKTVYPLCLYCNHARRIAVNGKSLAMHMIGHHRFTATVDSITAEELMPATIIAKLKSFLPQLEEHFFNSNSYCTYGDGAYTNNFNERIFECFQCRFVASTHKELYLHNRKMHLRTAILCFMCRANFFSFSEILCHICPGVPNKVSIFDVKFRCCLCDLDKIPSPFRLMVHLRKKHFACDVCLEDCRDQSKLSSHVWKHKLHHLCYRCGIAYRNKLDITKHLFWKHGTESTLCKRCLQKRWRHVYHFCIPPNTFICEVCNLCFSKAMHLRVHKRLHSGDFRYPCMEDNCEEKFISRKLLLKHALVHQVLSPEALPDKDKDPKTVENDENKDISEVDFKMLSDLPNIKQEVMEIKNEPFDDSEVESQKLRTDEKSDLAEKKETEKINTAGDKNGKNEEDKELRHLGSSQPRKKRKKNKRSKELLEDLNLTAPNLSESDSSNDSDSDSDSKTKSEIDALPRVMLSPPSETEIDEKENNSSEPVEPGQVLEIWKNFLKTQQDSNTVEELERLTATSEEIKQPKRMPIHVSCSDHDYCKIEEPAPPGPLPGSEPPVESLKDDFKKPATEVTLTPENSPSKKKQSKSPRRLFSKRSDASSSSSDSTSSSDSSCSCGSNCSCSLSESTSSSSSSSGDSDSSLASNSSVRKRHRKKSERDRMRKRSESMSPLKQHKLSVSITEVVNVDDEDAAKGTGSVSNRLPSPKEPLFYESDLETNESDTDEEFYDEHPQKLANELLAQKRAQLMAQTRLSPSHNYDIVENSRPSTPSLPEEIATNEKQKIKVKKKKRDRKSCKGQGIHTSHVAASEQVFAPAQTVSNVHQMISQQSSSPTATLTNSVRDSHTSQTNLYTIPQQTIYALPPPAILTEQITFTPRPLTMPPYGSSHRMSEGSSCSDADGSLKRSKRQRRPNKFYGYTSDDENLINGPPLMIGTRAFKPQPPPQLTWRKEDLPTPSKSILNGKNKTAKTPKSSSTYGNTVDGAFTGSSSKKSRLSQTGEEKSARNRPAKKRDAQVENKFPPIPTLKIRPSQIGLNTTINHSANYNTTDDTSSDDDISKGQHSLPSTSFNSSAVSQTLAPPIVLPSQPPPPPTPQTTAFNHRIPPALLPNPDFATLQYFKANNIRYPIRPPAGARQPRDGESVYCYCRCPYDEVSEMIACDGENCLIEWFHFECVGIMVAPQGKWFCAECRPKYSEELYPLSAAGQLSNV